MLDFEVKLCNSPCTELTAHISILLCYSPLPHYYTVIVIILTTAVIHATNAYYTYK